MSNKTLTVETIRTRGQVENLTPFQIARLLNAKLAEVGAQKNGELYQVRPQMMYNYDKNGMIVKGLRGVKSYSLDEADEFIAKIVAKYTPKVESTEVEGQEAFDLEFEAEVA